MLNKVTSTPAFLFLIDCIHARMQDKGTTLHKDTCGNPVTKEELVFKDIDIGMAISLVESDLSIRDIKLEWDNFSSITRYGSLIVQGACAYMMPGHIMLERGREYSVVDGGIGFNPPNLSDMMFKIYELELNSYHMKLDKIDDGIIGRKPMAMSYHRSGSDGTSISV